MLTASDKSVNNKLGLNASVFKFIIAIFYLVGIIGMAVPAVRPYFQMLTPFHLLLSTVILLLFHKEWSTDFYIFSSLAFLIGFGAEVVGVQTGLIFGDYTYGTVLGPKVLGVPLMIGVNWFLLVYITGSLFNNYITNDIIAALMAALLMVLLDFLIEPVAIALDFWTWHSDDIPLENYIGWLGVAFLIQLIYRKMSFNKENSVAIFLLICLGIFFGILAIIL
ncbi:MAG TPA: carotenoid biosynthesis protein [Anditalea sp.]|nr:carotenoid biosynthesis protein [Anditalea sp.]